MPYPDVSEIRKKLVFLKAQTGCLADAGYHCPPHSCFADEALRVCDEADKGLNIAEEVRSNSGVLLMRVARLDMQLIAQLQFIERVLNG